jgi:hypothetical protein|uniref:Uncharacterized protein n=1 Tax=viral metagenome TaxID=1070528 RepID=A0A6C0EH43_9ZZZZ
MINIIFTFIFNLFYYIFCSITNFIKIISKSYYIFPLFISLLLIYLLINYILSILEKEFENHNSSNEIITINISHNNLFQNCSIIILILFSNYLYKKIENNLT